MGRQLKRKLLTLSEVPPHLQFNKYIHTGYRPLTDFFGCVRSLFYWHNQTIDIYSHAIPLIYLVCFFKLDNWHEQSEISHVPLTYAHITACVAPLFGSVVYHTFMSCHHGPKTYSTLLQLDMVGVWAAQTFGGLTGIYTTIYCVASFTKLAFIVFYSLGCLVALTLALRGKTVTDRMMAFILQFVCRLIFLSIRAAGFGNVSTLPHGLLMDSLGLIAGAINSMRIPEKWLPPGKVDFAGNSHQIMHVLVTIGIYVLHHSATNDLRWMDRHSC